MSDTAHLKAVLNGEGFQPWQRAMAWHYAHRSGHGDVPKDPIKAGAWLLRAAGLGDSNAQVLAGKALRGDVDDPLLAGVTVPRNDTLAIYFLRQAARNGR